jgi:Outer membrane protein and related peptidoglycan-associated (lipo)proteins
MFFSSRLPVYLLLILPFGLAGQGITEDYEGCKDSKLLTRMRGCFIQSCDAKEFDQAAIRTGAPREANDPVKQLEGQTEILRYECSGKISPLQVVRNAENAMKQAGYQAVFSGRDENDFQTVTGRKGPQWLMVTASQGGDNNSITFYAQTAVAVGAMKQELAASAEAMATELETSGRMALYGINFATNSATITPDSEKALGEIVTLLKNQPEWKITVEGHTDNVGAKAANQLLSQKRAESVVAWLAGHGVEKARLASAGFGDTKPLEPNDSEEGKAKNRRVELVKR